MRLLQCGILVAVMAGSLSLLGGCSSGGHVDHYVSPKIEGETAKINLDEVQKAFWDTKGKDFNAWMAAFEKRVNEIYEGKEIISIDATRDNGKLVVTGYIDNKKQEGYKPGDEKLFAIEQTGEATNNEMPYRVSNGDGGMYYEGHHSILDNPILQMMLIHHMMGGFGGFGGRYYTPYDRVVVLHDSRNSWRATPQYSQQQTSNSGFFSRFKSKSLGGGYESKTGFGNSSFSGDAGQKRRTFGGIGSSSAPAAPEASSSGWGGRRSSGGIFGGGSSSGSMGGFRSRGWGGRRR